MRCISGLGDYRPELQVPTGGLASAGCKVSRGPQAPNVLTPYTMSHSVEALRIIPSTGKGFDDMSVLQRPG